MSDLRKMGPLAGDHPLVLGDKECPGCHEQFEEGQLVTLIAIGPGDDADAQEKAREGRIYNAIAMPVHWICATGEKEETSE